MNPDLLLTLYCVFIVFASLAGGWLPSVVRLTHLRMQLTMSFVAGLMLGVALLHMVPHAAEQAPVKAVGGAALLGILVMFFLLRVFHVHHYHDVPADEDRRCPVGLAVEHDHDHSHNHDHRHDDHGHGSHASHGEHSHGHHQMTWLPLFFGLAIHTLLDGVALGAAVSTVQGATSGWAGLGAFFAIVLHKPLDALSITALMRAGNWPLQTRTLVNVSFAMMCPLGALLLRLGAAQVGDNSWMVGCALGFSAGFFICIALGDLLPEVAFHSHDRIKLSLAVCIGVLLAFSIEIVHQQVHKGHQHEAIPRDVRQE